MNLQELIRTSGAYDATRAIQVGVAMGIFEAVARNAQTGAYIARRIRASERGTELLCNALVSLDLLKKTKDRFSLTALARKHLLKSSPVSYATMITFMEQNYRGFADLEKAVRTGRAIRRVDMFQDDPASLEKFIGAMHDLATVRGDAKIVARKLDLRPYRTLVDIGGGPGTFAIEFCKTNLQLTAAVFDLPATCRVARRLIKENDPTGRVSWYEGDYNRDPLPSGCDVAFLSNIIHSENERDNQRLVRKVYQALAPGGLIAIKDHILNDAATAPRDGAVFALTMLLFTRGRSYTAKEVKQWLVKAGFSKIKRLRMPAPMTADMMVGIKE